MLSQPDSTEENTGDPDYQYSQGIESESDTNFAESVNIPVQCDQVMGHGQTRGHGKSQGCGCGNVNVNQPPTSSPGWAKNTTKFT